MRELLWARERPDHEYPSDRREYRRMVVLWRGPIELKCPMNPGFEPTIDRTIVIVKEANSTGFADDTPWLARSNGFWNGGSF